MDKYIKSEKGKQTQKKYLQSDKGKAKQKRWQQSPSGKKFYRIRNWKKRGIIFFDYDLLYEIYINTSHCDNCNCELTTDRYSTSTTRCLDHDHETGEVRNIICHSCNVKRG